MIIFINNKSTKFCQSTLRVKKFIQERKSVPFFLPDAGVNDRNAVIVLQ